MNQYTLNTGILVKCTYEGFASELKEGNYYLAYQHPLNPGDVILHGVKEAGLLPIPFAKYHFKPVR